MLHYINVCLYIYTMRSCSGTTTTQQSAICVNCNRQHRLQAENPKNTTIQVSDLRSCELPHYQSARHQTKTTHDSLTQLHYDAQNL